MNDDHDKLDSFLRRNAPQPPAPPPGEKQRIWRAIAELEQRGRNGRPWWQLLLRPGIALPALATAMILLVAIQLQQQKRNARIDRALSAALAYQLEDIESDTSLF